MILILDTDHHTLVQRHSEPAHSRLRARLDAFPQEDVRTTIVSFAEQMRGWLSIVARSRDRDLDVGAYQLLHNSLAFFSSIPVLPYDNHAAEQFDQLRLLRLRIGSMDLKIAAIALSQNGVLLSRNLKDFSRVPNLRVEDWSL